MCLPFSSNLLNFSFNSLRFICIGLLFVLFQYEDFSFFSIFFSSALLKTEFTFAFTAFATETKMNNVYSSASFCLSVYELNYYINVIMVFVPEKVSKCYMRRSHVRVWIVYTCNRQLHWRTQWCFSYYIIHAINVCYVFRQMMWWCKCIGDCLYCEMSFYGYFGLLADVVEKSTHVGTTSMKFICFETFSIWIFFYFYTEKSLQRCSMTFLSELKTFESSKIVLKFVIVYLRRNTILISYWIKFWTLFGAPSMFWCYNRNDSNWNIHNKYSLIKNVLLSLKYIRLKFSGISFDCLQDIRRYKWCTHTFNDLI